MKNSPNLVAAFAKSVRRLKEKDCLVYKEKGQWLSLSWLQTKQEVEKIAGGLKKFGIKKGDRVAIFSKTRYEWTLTDLGILASQAVTVPIYESNTAEQAAYILNNSNTQVIFVENAVQLKKILSKKDEIKSLKQIVVIDSSQQKELLNEDGIYSFEELKMLGAQTGEQVFIEAEKNLNADDEASYVYTSGTTGNPKGAVMIHQNFLAENAGLKKVVDFQPDMMSLMFLPLAHILGRVTQFLQLEIGFIQAYAESIDRLIDNIGEVKPHVMVSVPRIFEKVHTRVLQGVEAGSGIKKAIFSWALGVAKKRSEALLNNRPIPLDAKLGWPIAYKLVFSKLHQRMGGRVRFFVSGGAPLTQEIAEFFHAAGFLILEGYGLTETTAAAAVNAPDAVKFGTVGKPVPGTTIKIADDGEILIKGGIVFKGYYKDKEKTAAAFDKDGFFKSGDIGEIDSDGFVKITDRKKDIIITAGGKNIAPQNIENLIKTDPLISQVMVHGDRRKFLSALVTLDLDEVKAWAKQNEVSHSKIEDLYEHKKLYQEVKKRIDEKNNKLAKYETIKKFSILRQDFTVESGELTPTLKVKRKFTSQKYKDILDSFYQE